MRSVRRGTGGAAALWPSPDWIKAQGMSLSRMLSPEVDALP